MKNNFEEDCIHLHACRRFAKIAGHNKPRLCNREQCTAYRSEDEFYTREDVENIFRDTVHLAFDAYEYGIRDERDLISDDVMLKYDSKYRETGKAHKWKYKEPKGNTK